ncbi:MAG: MFS transporter, partial [Deltaproteobacteria bacterium]|nr:MFS transporter [Deltaproteobacteria bacterium]
MSQLSLLPDRRFWALFSTQFLGAFNDNLFKNALVIMIAYRAMRVGSLGPDELVALSAGLFILPFFLFSATAGQIADKLSKARLMRWVKAAEIAIMGLAAVGFVTGNLVLLLAVLFLMGLQSTFFGPAKYSVLPELLAEDELVGGNALVEMGTFVAILLGTISGGVLIAMEGTGPTLLAGGVVAVAVLGWLASLKIPKTPSGAPDLVVAWDPVRPTLETFRATKQNRPVFLSILGISWFWFLGASLLTVLPSYGKDLLHGQELVVTFLLSLFCIGIALGSMLCERMSKERLELGLVPFGSIGMSVFALDLFLVGNPQAGLPTPDALYTLTEALRLPGMWRIIIDFSGIAVFSGFYTVPLYTMIQQRSAPEVRSRVIAGNNILNALFMVASAIMLMGLHAVGATIPQIFGVLAVLNAAVAIYIYSLIPEFLLRFVVWMLASVAYR